MRSFILMLALVSCPIAAMAQDSAAVAPAEGPTEAPADASAVAPDGAVVAPADAVVATDDAAVDPAPARAIEVLGEPAEGMGQIVFFRPKKFAGAAVNFKVREGTDEVGKLSSGSYVIVDTTPGVHTYTVHSEAKDVLTLEIEPGETYYVEGSISMGFLAGRPNLAPSSEAAFDAARKKKIKRSPHI